MAIAPTRNGGTTPGYRVAARIAGHWMLTGPTFNSREAASAHMEGVRSRFKRVVASTISNPRRDHGADLTLDRNRLAFVRFLVDTRRLDELVAG